MSDIYPALLQELRNGTPFVVATVIGTKGSTPREKGAKMLVRSDGSISGTIGGGKFESLVVEAAAQTLATGELETRTFPLHEHDNESFGAICGGEVTVLLEPHAMKQRLLISGAGHCGQALAELALNCGWPVTVFDDREELFDTSFYRDERLHLCTEANALDRFAFQRGDCMVLVSKGHPEDRAALRSILNRNPAPRLAYLGMIGSERKVSMVLSSLEEEGFSKSELEKVYAPIGLDIGSESPAEIAVSIMAEILQVTRGARGGHMRLK
ncbi:putative xanthine dehydrogenase subunit A [Pontiella desulfatans]|uniref:Putative xanthine dehydrogenase subunit A n=1 Tax=Pontiella desulfatans TaxID=2750659 RepID=A0A6C2UB25_PONDE|nr:XdhC/CoxI family protein [Pontiella desulfatans]VGO17362.1 putative xanthine dehydrogenase subunit A [Pontiella desulfatans]